MQQLRIEMQKARELLQLVVEREQLKEAEVDVDKEIFERTLYDLDTENHFGITVSETPYRYKLKFEHLLKSVMKFSFCMPLLLSVYVLMPLDAYLFVLMQRFAHRDEPPIVSEAGSSSQTSLSSIKAATAALKIVASTKGANRDRGDGTTTAPEKGPGSSSASGGGGTGLLTASSSSTGGAASATAAVGADSEAVSGLASKKEKKEKKAPGSRRKLGADGAGVAGAEGGAVGEDGSTVTTSGAGGGSGSGTSSGTAAVDWLLADVIAPVPVARVNPAVPGPPTVCNPSWPSFMAELPIREQVCKFNFCQLMRRLMLKCAFWVTCVCMCVCLQYRIPRSLSDYIEDLELRDYDDPLLPQPRSHFWGALPGVSSHGRSWARACAEAAHHHNHQQHPNGEQKPAAENGHSSLKTNAAADKGDTLLASGLPSKYRCRGRVGRGGRLVIDRVPVSFRLLGQFAAY
jgi:hypothetical protein